MEQYYSMIWDALGMFLFLGIELSVLFIAISFGVSLLQQFIPDSKIQSLLSGKRGVGYVFAAALGSITPFCSCSTIPMLRGLLKAKAGFGPTMTFLFCSPLLNPIIIGLFLATFGTRVTVYYVAIALVVSIVAGFLLDMMKYERYVIPEHESVAPSCCCDSSAKKSTSETEKSIESCCCTPEPVPCCSQASTTSPESTTSCCEPPASVTPGCCGSAPTVATPLKPTLRFRSQFAWYDAITQFKSVFIYLLVGVALGAFVYGFVPSDFIAKYASGDSVWAIPIAAVIGIPLYVRAEVLIPLSAVLVEKGMGLGAVMALIIGGGGASITEVILLKSMFRMPMIIAFLVVILGMAVFAGFFFQYVL